MKSALKVTLIALSTLTTASSAFASNLAITCKNSEKKVIAKAIIDMEDGSENAFEHSVYGEPLQMALYHYESDPDAMEEGQMMVAYAATEDLKSSASLAIYLPEASEEDDGSASFFETKGKLEYASEAADKTGTLDNLVCDVRAAQ